MSSAKNHQSPDETRLESPRVAVDRRSVTDIVVSAVRRGWWLFVLAVVLASSLALVGYAKRTPQYQSEQAYVILVAPAGASTTYDLYQAAVWEETIGHALAEGRLTTVAGGFASEINAQLAEEKGVGAPLQLSTAQLKQSLVWSNSGNSVVLTAYWTTPQGASALVRATTAALESGDLSHVTIWRGALPPQMVARVIPSGPATPPSLNQSRQAAAEQLLLTRVILGVAASVLLLFIWEWVQRLVRRRTHSNVGQSTPAAAGTTGAQDVHLASLDSRASANERTVKYQGSGEVVSR
jgi:hypothetical protein